MLRTWQLQEAKNKLSKVVEEALTRGPQLITRHGVEAAIVLSYAEYRSLVLMQKPLADFFRELPLVESDLDLTRDQRSLRADITL